MTRKSSMIPKTIHYIWLGKKEPNNLAKSCISSWYRNLPGYKIVLWNENNLPLEELRKKNKFFDQCLKLKLWAFVSDYLRLFVLYKEGGIYLDTDVEVIKSFDGFLNNKVFFGYEYLDYIGTGIIGAEKESAVIKRLMDFYDAEIWNVKYYTNPHIFTELNQQEPEIFKVCHIYPQDVFSPFDPREKFKGIVGNKDTITIHWYNTDWGLTRKGYVFLNTKYEKRPVIKQLLQIRKNIGYYRHKYNGTL